MGQQFFLGVFGGNAMFSYVFCVRVFFSVFCVVRSMMMNEEKEREDRGTEGERGRTESQRDRLGERERD